MSVIIRLQNLPWAANAADIRTYFTGLSIPEGGVHIVGGEQGDAFIAFSTDEDARQAMLLDGGKLKEVKIKLFLSSRAEMLRVIEQARQQTLTVQNLIHSTSAPQPAPVVAPVSAPIPTPTPMAMLPQTPLINPTNLPVNANISQPKPEEYKDNDDALSKDDDNSRERRDRYRSPSRERARSRGRDNSRDRSRGRYRDSRRRRDRSRSRDRHRRRSRSRDRRRNSRDKETKDKENSRNKRKDSKEVEIVEIKESPNAIEEPPWESPQNMPKVPLLPDPPAVPSVLLQMPNGKESVQNVPPAPMLNFQPQNPSQDRPPFPYNPQMGPVPPQAFMQMRGREGWNPAQMMGAMDPMQMGQMGMPRPMMNNMEMGMPGFPNFGMAMFPGANPNEAMWRQTMVQPGPQEVVAKNEEQDLCIEIRGLPLNASYIDVKKLFDGLSIPPDGIKMINDNHGNRTGIAYVRFSVAHHKKAALNQNGKKVRSNIVEVIHLRESIFKTAIDNFKPEKEASVNSADMDVDSGDNTNDSWSRARERERDSGKERERDRDRDRGDRERVRGDKDRDRDRRNHTRNGDPRMSNDPRVNDPRISNHSRIRGDPTMNSDSRVNNDPRMINDPRMNNDSRISSDPRAHKTRMNENDDQETDCVLIQSLPLHCNENDIADFFDELDIVPINIYLVFDNLGQPVGDAFCQFNSFEEAQKATTKNNERLGRNIVSVVLIDKEEMERTLHPPGNQMWGMSQRGHQMGPMHSRGGGGPPQVGGGGPGMSGGGPLLMTPHYPERFRDNERNRFEERPTRWDRDRDEQPRGSGGRFRGRPDTRGSGRERGGPTRGSGRERGGPMRGSRSGPGGDSYSNRRGGPPPRGGSRNNNNRDPSPYIDGNTLDSFGRPGCVVALENLHFRAEIDEIIEFFKGFSIEHENVIRRFDDTGRPTGDARVSLNCPADAMRAVKILNFKLLRGRAVKVSLLQ